MHRRFVAELCQRHAGEDIWVIGSASSMDFVAPEFFANKCVIGVNDVFRKYPCTYLVRKENTGAADALASGIPLICSEYDCGNRTASRNSVEGTVWYFDHVHNDCVEMDLSVVGTNRIVVSHSTITSAIHIAADMGAANIMICGHDGGMFEGRMTYRGYYGDDPAYQQWYRDWVRKIMQQSRILRDRLKEVYGCQIHSLNPFIGFDLEGRRFET
ncbi:MAG: hypothetical protein ACKVT0_05750 [Planctomycetaceae bacterium]